VQGASLTVVQRNATNLAPLLDGAIKGELNWLST